MIKLAIIGTGGMAHAHAGQFSGIKGVELVAACDIDQEKAAEFARKHDIPQAFGDAEKMLEACDCDAVSVVTPDSSHAALSILALERGKHVLCEKPLATCYEDAMRMAEVAKGSGKINMVNFSYRNSSAIHKAAELVRAGELGRVYHFEAHYLQGWLASTEWGNWREKPGLLWRLSTGHGSKGVLGDLGVHILDFASYPVGAVSSVNCRLKTFDKADGGRLGDYVLDANDSAVITMEMEDGALGSVCTTRWAAGHQNSLWLTIHGDQGAVRIDLDASYQMLEVCRRGKNGRMQPWERIYSGETPSMWERFVKAVETGVQDQPDFQRGAEVQRLLDACEASDAEGRTIDIQSFKASRNAG